ncbi:MAG TPA: YifB family Mg chelatase-like AAA ATPase [Fibrobacteraceae bacterium]|jgi:magnesium chelatase family protein|nr:YifB family Mg chelatase-like AAA ATPase [Fibrobacter sp.]HPW95060.1 YifB family Mg chelatase-like AAA ATPase [Fibrobacteraceae bacterium]
MFQRIRSYCLSGIHAIPVSVEVDSSLGLPGFTLVGLPDSAVRESRERVVSAVRASGYSVTGTRTTVNLSPADLRKEGSSLDLPLAIGMLLASGEFEVNQIDRFVFLGELSLDGLLKPVRGVLSVAMSLVEEKDSVLVVPKDNIQEASLVEGLNVLGVSSLLECIEELKKDCSSLLIRSQGFSSHLKKNHPSYPDFKNIIGMEGVKRALEIAASGNHNFLLVGSPGSGKTLCAKCLPSILPEMTEDEIIESTRIHSCAKSIHSQNFSFIAERPFRSPHHSSTMVSLVGGGHQLLPGEVSLAHNGVLFLDELPEFNRQVLEALREPMEEGSVCIHRASGSIEWPARFMMGAAMNPCPCGYSMDLKKECTCLPDMKVRYWSKISGPLLDRIDLQISVPAMDITRLKSTSGLESSATIKKRVKVARTFQEDRFKNSKILYNSEMTSLQTREEAKMDSEAEHFAITAAEKMCLSARGYYRVLKVARTIADLRSSKNVEKLDLAEAFQYRLLK